MRPAALQPRETIFAHLDDVTHRKLSPFARAAVFCSHDSPAPSFFHSGLLLASPHFFLVLSFLSLSSSTIFPVIRAFLSLKMFSPA